MKRIFKSIMIGIVTVLNPKTDLMESVFNFFFLNPQAKRVLVLSQKLAP